MQRSDLDSLVLCAFTFNTSCKQDNDVAHNVKSTGLGKWGKIYYFTFISLMKVTVLEKSAKGMVLFTTPSSTLTDG